MLNKAFPKLTVVFDFGCMARGILVPQPGTEPAPRAGGAQSLNHWTIGEVPEKTHF